VTSVISQQAKQGIDYIFAKSARNNLILDPGDVCNIEMLNESSGHKFLEKDIVVLTISSFLFRVMTIFHIGEDAATRDYFLKKTPNKSLTEVFSEVGNLCSGAMNRELLQHFPHLGMSTPYTLSSRCLSFLSELNPGHLSRHAITINGSAHLQATVCMCGYAPIDFTVDTTATADTSGELELF
jgi:hypothetical protein